MKKKLFYLLFLLSVCLINIQKSKAQESQGLYSNSFSLGINSDAFTGMELGYHQKSTISNIPSCYYLNLNIPLLITAKQKKLDTWEIKAGAALELAKHKRFILLSDFNLFSIKHSQILGTFLPVGFNLKLTPGYRTKNGYIGLQTKFRQVLFTFMNHSEYVNEKFHEIYDSENRLVEIEPKNGLFAFTGSSLNYGIEGMFKLSNKLNMFYEMGMVNYLSKYTGSFDAMMIGQIPFYTDIQLNYKINQK